MFEKLKRFFLPADYLLAHKVKDANLSSISVYGAGELGMAVVQRLLLANIKLENWYDGMIKDASRTLMGQEVKAPSNLQIDQPSVLLIASEAYADEIVQSCVASGYAGQFIRI